MNIIRRDCLNNRPLCKAKKFYFQYYRRNNQEFDDTLSEIQRDPALRQINLETVLFLPAVRLDFIKSDVLGVLAALPKVGPDYAPVSSCFEELNRVSVLLMNISKVQLLSCYAVHELGII